MASDFAILKDSVINISGPCYESAHTENDVSQLCHLNCERQIGNKCIIPDYVSLSVADLCCQSLYCICAVTREFANENSNAVGLSGDAAAASHLPISFREL